VRRRAATAFKFGYGRGAGHGWPQHKRDGKDMSDYDKAALDKTFTRRAVMAHGVPLNVLEGGAGPLLVLVPGWPQSWYAWRKLMPTLAADYRVVVFDPPGLGGQPAPATGGCDTANIASHIDPLLNALGASDCLLVTHDIGCWIGYAYAVRQPRRVRKLVLVDAAIPGLAPPEVYKMTPDRLARTWHFAFNYLPELPEMLITGREREFLSWLFRSKSVDWTKAFDQAAIDEYTRIYAAPGSWSNGLRYYRDIFASIAQNQETAKTKLPMPVLAIGGEIGIGAAMRQSLDGLAENLQGAVIPKCGHYVPEEAPGELLALTSPFLRGG
jgi:microsomal epoxide hydrolase